MSSTRLVSRIAYNSVYGFLCLILTLLLLIVPGDFVEQALTTTHQLINLIVIAIVYVITILIVLFIYFLRLYVTRTVLASIPKPFVPIEPGDVNKEVYTMVAKSQSQSAAIAWESRPRVITPTGPLESVAAVPGAGDGKATGNAVGVEGIDDLHHKESRRSLHLSSSKPSIAGTHGTLSGILLSPLRPVWGEVEHYGWGSPASPDLPNLQYATVMAELPNLIEAKAVAQAPTDPDSVPNAPRLDPEAVILLQRAPNMTMRSYITHLTSLDVLHGSQDIVNFLDLYERVRFCGHPMSNATFRNLMHLFAELLRAIQPLHPRFLYSNNNGTDNDDDGSSLAFDGHIDDDAPEGSIATTRTPSPSLRRGMHGFDRNSISPHTPRLGARNSSAATRGQYRTAPTTPRSRATGTFASRSPSSASSSASSFTQSRRPYPASQSSSSGSIRSGASVIRLAMASDTGDLPYVLRLVDTY
ncbi:hypothetical protein F5B22DRAFT_628156 [Xylaria bambusicola]|uniref:uncharacterized protein n=1 Tax=Xylaria bambusicola TaxID=326684 RepID=UPI002007CD1C|nr:uncharacterized protein F5B22DRAFT_628156 [Xylaria bambusicola]KAI0505308.1 hypothetical protein F5B22DRAFT_628156 [Xylaria bambusicola]